MLKHIIRSGLGRSIARVRIHPQSSLNYVMLSAFSCTMLLAIKWWLNIKRFSLEQATLYITLQRQLLTCQTHTLTWQRFYHNTTLCTNVRFHTDYRQTSMSMQPAPCIQCDVIKWQYNFGTASAMKKLAYQVINLK